MSNYSDALNRKPIEVGQDKPVESPGTTIIAKTQRLSQWPGGKSLRTTPLAEPALSVAIPQTAELQRSISVPAALAGHGAIRQLCERIAPRSIVERGCRIAISGCRAGDGASSIAAAFALDLSQRLSVRTLLVDANLRAPNLHCVISAGSRQNGELTLDGSLQLRPTGYPRLTLLTTCLEEDDLERDLVIAELETVLRSFPAVVIDLGVTRLDPRMLPLVRPSDPIMLVVRYGQTQRQELATTTAALRSADRTVAGVILNAQPSHSYPSSGEHSLYE
jgi:Mrp family chromosome partitioning ATPase